MNEGTSPGHDDTEPSVNRRSILRTAGLLTAGMGLQGLDAETAHSSVVDSPAPQGATMIGVPFERHSTVRIGIIGLGHRGGGMIDLFLALPGVRVVALCDPVQDKVAKAAAKVESAGWPAPAVYTKGEDDFRNLCRRDDLDFVYVATPWESHFEMARTAMLSGKHVGVECPIAVEIGQLWDLVDVSETTRKHCMQLENCCYDRTEMRVLRMAHGGVFGELVHGAGAYIHDLRHGLFSDHYEGGWRRRWHTRMRGNLYPTHGFGPVANYMDINRGDRAVRITTLGSAALGLSAYRKEHVPVSDPSWKETYIESDMTISLVQTARGRLIRLEHDVSNPHPYSRVNILGGTKGVFEDYPPRIYVEPDMANGVWGDFAKYDRWDHWLWKKYPNPPGSSDGMDYLMLLRLVQCMRLGLPPDFDVYDAATWASPLPLSNASLKQGGVPQSIPDFTRGRWMNHRSGVDSEEPQEDRS
ncbi:Gfo/Idh/MocA family protein [Streptomyces cupreus]|uniref:Glycosyl hydrolase family 109 protein n=1 Tax=Streptomyces cupreus TaxID=2759956 RepID=A0A7X1J8L0_9ACTN|nr:Gfo/Idh/MocA family oxidoreductase [Streptomyces cupreus]MBC2906106.1 Gfo/Idh/MocA family oxidoreductase [Streptomyces cupreus]